MKKTNNSLLILVGICALAIGMFWYSFWYKPCPESTASTCLMVGTSADYKPFSFKENDEIVGFDIDVVKEVAHRLNKTIQFQDMPFEMLVPQIQLGRIHLIAAGMTVTPARAERVIFTEPYLTGDPLVIITLKDRPLTYEELDGKNVIVNQGYTADFYLSKNSHINLIKLPSVADALMSLNAKRADAFVTASNTIKPFLDQYGHDNFNVAFVPETDENSALAISKEYPELAEQVKTVIRDMLADGTIDALKEKWHVQ